MTTYEDMVRRYGHRQGERFFNLTPQQLSEYVACCATTDAAQCRMVRSAYRGTLMLFGVWVRVRPLRATS